MVMSIWCLIFSSNFYRLISTSYKVIASIMQQKTKLKTAKYIDPLTNENTAKTSNSSTLNNPLLVNL